MKKINYAVNEYNYIIAYTLIPFNENEPFIEMQDEDELIIGISRLIDGKIDNTIPSENYCTMVKEKNIKLFREYREEKLRQYDILRINIQNGDYNPSTNLPYEPITLEEKEWRLEMLNFTALITYETTEEDYPKVPERLQ